MGETTNGVGAAAIAHLRALADRCAGDDAGRAARMLCALRGMEAAGYFADEYGAMSLVAFAEHVAAALDPDAHARRRARVASDCATDGDRRLRRVAKVLAAAEWDESRDELRDKPRSKPLSRAEVVRRIMPELQAFAKELREQGLSVSLANTQRTHRTVSDWLRAGPPSPGQSWIDWLDM